MRNAAVSSFVTFNEKSPVIGSRCSRKNRRPPTLRTSTPSGSALTMSRKMPISSGFWIRGVASWIVAPRACATSTASRYCRMSAKSAERLRSPSSSTSCNCESDRTKTCSATISAFPLPLSDFLAPLSAFARSRGHAANTPRLIRRGGRATTTSSSRATRSCRSFPSTLCGTIGSPVMSAVSNSSSKGVPPSLASCDCSVSAVSGCFVAATVGPSDSTTHCLPPATVATIRTGPPTATVTCRSIGVRRFGSAEAKVFRRRAVSWGSSVFQTVCPGCTASKSTAPCPNVNST